MPAPSEPNDTPRRAGEERRRTSVARKLGLSLSVLVVLLLLGEAAVRVRQYLKYGTFDRIHVLEAEEDGGLRLPPAGRDTGAIRINSKSFRGPEIEEPKPEGRIRLAFLGGSTTFCAEVSGNEAAWPALVTAGLGELYPEREFDYVNAGVPGYTTETSMKNYEQRVRQLEPDVLFVYHATNDITSDTRKAAKRQGAYTDHADSDSWLAKLSLAWYLVEKNLAFRQRSEGARESGGKLALEDDLTARFERQLGELIDAGYESCALVVVPTFSIRARRSQPRDEQFRALESAFYYMPYMTVETTLEAFDRYNAVIREVAPAHGALLVEVAERIPADDEHFADTVHFTDAGSAEMATVVLEALLGDERFLGLVGE